MYLKTQVYNQFDSIELKESFFKEFTLPDHFHDKYCIGFLEQGIKKCVVEGQEGLIHSNTISIVNPYQIHSDQNIDNDGCLFKMLYINKDVINFFSKRITGKSNSNIAFSNELITDSLVTHAFSDLFIEMDRPHLLESKLIKVIELLVKRCTKQPDVEAHTENINAIADSVEFARLNFADKIDLNKMAVNCKLSKFQFIRYFKKMTGLTPASYMILCRFNHAKSLIFKGLPLGQVALESGFYDHPQFCKYFKYFSGLSPAQFKASCNIIQA